MDTAIRQELTADGDVREAIVKSLRDQKRARWATFSALNIRSVGLNAVEARTDGKRYLRKRRLAVDSV